MRSTTIVAVRHRGRVAMAGDGQVSVGDMIMKSGAKKIRRMYSGKVLSGFAGSTADALTLFEKFEKKLDEFRGNLQRASVELAKDWRTDKVLRRLEALLIVADSDHTYVVSGAGDVIEPDDGIAAIGSGAGYAAAAARSMVKHSQLSTEEIAEESIRMAASLCVYTNDRIAVEALGEEKGVS
ncbi:MAG: ATP-dependent protease subunit HslV [bacterium]